MLHPRFIETPAWLENNAIVLLTPCEARCGYRTVGEKLATTEAYDRSGPDEKHRPYNDPRIGFHWMSNSNVPRKGLVSVGFTARRLR